MTSLGSLWEQGACVYCSSPTLGEQQGAKDFVLEINAGLLMHNTGRILMVSIHRTVPMDTVFGLVPISGRNLCPGETDLFWHLAPPACHRLGVHRQDYTGQMTVIHLEPAWVAEKLTLHPSYNLRQTTSRRTALELSARLIKPSRVQILTVSIPRPVPENKASRPALVHNGILGLGWAFLYPTQNQPAGRCNFRQKTHVSHRQASLP